MKKIIIFSSIILITIILGIALMIGCKKENNDTQTDDSMKSFIQTMQEGAKVHNEAMSYCYEQLVILQPKENFLELVESLSIDFINFHPFFQSDIDGASKVVKAFFLKTINSKSSLSALWYEEDENLLSQSQKKWLTYLNDAIDKNDNVEQMAMELNKIRDLVLKEGSDDDQRIVIIAVEIAKETMNYWYNNFYNWQQLNFSKSGWFNWKETAKWDIGGAVGGALTGNPGAIVPGAVAASACDAVIQVLDHFWK